MEKSFIAVLKEMFSLKADSASHDEIRDRLIGGGQITGTNMCVLICAMIIASVGLNTGSTATIIGAMLISPLMGSILAMAYGTAANDPILVRNHLTGFGIQIAKTAASHDPQYAHHCHSEYCAAGRHGRLAVIASNKGS